jgi:hypothetical protein
MLPKGIVHILGERRKNNTDSIMLLRMAHILELRNLLFLEFSCQYFWIVVDHGQLRLWRAKPFKGGILYDSGSTSFHILSRVRT